jgi:hypothetical protein
MLRQLHIQHQHNTTMHTLPASVLYHACNTLHMPLALTSSCYAPCVAGADGRPRLVALSPQGRPLVDEESGRPVLLSLGPNGLPLSESRSHRVSWVSGQPNGLPASFKLCLLCRVW